MSHQIRCDACDCEIIDYRVEIEERFKVTEKQWLWRCQGIAEKRWHLCWDCFDKFKDFVKKPKAQE